MKIETLEQLQKDINQVARDHGWYEGIEKIPEPVWWDRSCALTHGEISEALECIRKPNEFLYYTDGKPEGLSTEIADTCIRILDLMTFFRVDAHPFWDQGMTLVGSDPVDQAAFLNMVHRQLSRASFQNFRALQYVLNLLGAWSRELKIDLWGMMILKHEYNKTRPYRHGGKAL